MSKVTEFVVNAPTAVTRAPSYLVDPGAVAKMQPYWPADNPAAKPGTNQMPTAPKLIGQSYPVQIRRALTNYYRYIGQIPSRKSLERQVKQLSVHYQDLQKLGFDIKDVTTFGLRHAKALLAKWQGNQCAPNSVYVRWSGLRTWSRVLGKNGMLGQLKDLQPEFDRRPDPSKSNRNLDRGQLAYRSQHLQSKPDLTVYLVDRLCRELDLTREDALQVELDAVEAVVGGKAAVLRVGKGAEQKNVPHAQHNLALYTEILDFMVSRNRKTLAWSHLDLDAALQKYTLRLAYVTKTLFGENKRGSQAKTQEGGAA